jgi:hypothetical protein
MIDQSKRLLVILFLFVCDSVYAVDIPVLIRKAGPAIVQIFCRDQDGSPTMTGTGFFISPDGKLLTNEHIIHGAGSIVAVAIGGQRYSKVHILSAPDDREDEIETGIESLGDAVTDLVELKFDDAKDVPYLSLGNAVEGERVMIIGYPDGHRRVNDGTVSAFQVRGSILKIAAMLAHGNSGSPIIDMNGLVVGVAVLIDENREGTGYAISAKAVRLDIERGSPAVDLAVEKPSATPRAWNTSAADYGPPAVVNQGAAIPEWQWNAAVIIFFLAVIVRLLWRWVSDQMDAEAFGDD